jgi:hypothetical protein
MTFLGGVRMPKLRHTWAIFVWFFPDVPALETGPQSQRRNFVDIYVDKKRFFAKPPHDPKNPKKSRFEECNMGILLKLFAAFLCFVESLGMRWQLCLRPL